MFFCVAALRCVALDDTGRFVDFDDANELVVFDKDGLSVRLHSSFQ